MGKLYYVGYFSLLYSATGSFPTAARKASAMLRGLIFFSVALLLSGCQRFTPPVQPNVSLFPTVFPVRILEHATPAELAEGGVRRSLGHTGWEDGLGPFGLDETNAELIVRGLRQRGYAELDARRAGGPIRWIAFRALPDGETLLLTAGYDRRPPAPHLTGTDLAVPAREQSRLDAYSYPIQVHSWQGRREGIPMVVERIVPLVKGREGYWEIRHLMPLASLAG